MLYMGYILHMNEIMVMHRYRCTLYPALLLWSWFGFLCFKVVHKDSKVMAARAV